MRLRPRTASSFKLTSILVISAVAVLAQLPQATFAQTTCPAVPDNGLAYVFRFSFGTNGSGPGQFGLPSAIAVDPNGRLLVVDNYNYRVEVFDPNGAFLFQFGQYGTLPGEFSGPLGVAAGPAGEIVVSDTYNSRIQVFDASGAPQLQFGSYGSAPGQFITPWGVDVDSSGRILVADSTNNRIQVFDADGLYLFEFGGAGSGPGQFNNPAGVAVDGLGRIMVADTYNHRVQVFDSAGIFQFEFGAFGAGNGQFSYLFGLSGDGGGRIAVADLQGNRIQVFDASGVFVTSFGGPGAGYGQLSTPYDVAFAATGDIVVADSSNSRVQVFLASTNAADTDGDGTPNCLDGCPSDLSKLDPGVCGCGAPDVDTDGDTYLDCVETCPLDPDKTYPGQCGCGIPDTDTDSDSVADCNDECPLDPGKTLAGICGCGVSDADNDADGSADCQDICQGTTDGPSFLDSFGGRGGNELIFPVATAVDSMGRVFVLDRDTRSVAVFSPSGAPLFHFGTGGFLPGQLGDPRGMAVDSADRVYIADAGNQRIQVFDSTGAFLTSIGSSISALDVAVDSTGRILATDGATQTVLVFDSNGVLITSFGGSGSGPGQFDGLYAVTADAADNILAVDLYGGRLQVFDPNGSYQHEVGGFGYGPGQLAYPVDIAVDAAGRIVETDGGGNRIQVFDASGAFLFQFGSIGSGNGQLNAPYGATVDATGRFFVADAGNRRIQAFDSSGAFLFKFGTYDPAAPGNVNGAVDVALDGTGRIIVADGGNARVQVFDSNGAYLFAITGFVFPTSVATDSMDRILVLDLYANQVSVFDSSGAFQFMFGNSGSGPGEFNLPRGIATGAGDRILVADSYNYRIQVFDSSGAFQFQVGSQGSGPGDVNYPYGVAEDSTGRILVADTGNYRVQVFDSGGVFLSSIGTYGAGDGQFYSVDDVYADAQDRIIALDQGSYRIQVFDSTGSFQFKFGSQGVADGQFYFPRGVALDSAGQFIVADYDRVQILAATPNAGDTDGDGSANCHDCNDTDASIHPGALDSSCDAVDQDCDGSTDEEYQSTPTTCGVGACASTGATSCAAGVVQDSCTPGPASAEMCDGLDNDCDSASDEDNPGGGVGCATGVPGVCAAGLTVCTGGGLQCDQTTFPSAEVCDGLDNDCDSAIDDDVVAGNIVSMSDGTGGYPTLSAVVPITLTDLTGQGVLSADVSISYNPTVIAPTLVSPGSLAAACTLTPNLNTPGTAVISIFCTTEMTGSGTLAEITFQVIGAPGSSSPLYFNASQLNEGTPRVCRDNGLFLVAADGAMTGRILYYRDSNTGSEPSAKPVTGATVALTGTGPAVPDSSVTGPAGTYGFAARPLVQQYRTLPSKAGDFRGAISSLDAARVARHLVGLATLTASQQIAGDVSGNGSLSSLDAAHIAQFAVGLISQMPVAMVVGSDWFFVPAAAPVVNQTATLPSGPAAGRLDYNPLVTPAPDQDYRAGLYGDVTGNFVDFPPLTAPGGSPESLRRGRVAALGGQAPVSRDAGQARMRLSAGKLQPDGTLAVQIMASGADEAVSFDLELGYDENLVRIESVQTGAAASGFTLAHAAGAGSLRMALFSAESLGGAGALVEIRLRMIGEPGVAKLGLTTSVDEGRIPASGASASIRLKPRREPQRK